MDYGLCVVEVVRVPFLIVVDDADEGLLNALGLNRLVGRIDELEGVTYMRVLTGLADLKMSMFVQATMGLKNLLS